MKAFVINLDRRPDRMEKISKTLQDLDIQFERVAAIDARQVDVWAQSNKVVARIYNDFRTPPLGMVAAFCSHRLIWREIVKRELPQALIFEDDVVGENFDPDILNVNFASTGLDLLRLEELTIPYRIHLATKPFSMPLIGRQAVGAPSYGAAAYVVTLEGAKKLLKAERFWFNPDHFDIWERVYCVKTAVLRPNMFVQADPTSDTTDTMRYSGTIQGIIADYATKREPSFNMVLKRLKRWPVNATQDILSFVLKKLVLFYLGLKHPR